MAAISADMSSKTANTVKREILTLITILLCTACTVDEARENSGYT
jgi:hypothetical protein